MLGEIFNLDKIITLLRYIAPGILIAGTYSYFYLGRIETKDLLLKALISAVLFQSLIYNPFDTADADAQKGAAIARTALSSTFINFALYLVLPVSIGFFLALTIRENWIGRSLAWAGLQTIHPTPTAWDWKFRNTRDRHYVIVTLKDGTEWYGYFGNRSFVSSSNEERDILLEKVYKEDENRNWVEQPSSVLITAGEIRSIEFFKA